MGNEYGFVTTRPDAFLGAETVLGGAATVMGGSRFTVPGSGLFNVDEIGVWLSNRNDSSNKAAIYAEDNSTNKMPTNPLSNSISDVLATPAINGIVSAAYSTKPQVTGGVSYWLVFGTNNLQYYYRASSGGESRYMANTSFTYPNFPGAGATWTTVGERIVNIYALISAVVGGFKPAWAARQRRAIQGGII